eukprot:768270-Hanusia_phi.AAC.4
MADAICYGKYLDETYPLAEDPKAIKPTLKPHQLTAIHKAMMMEQNGYLRYNIEGREFEASTNICQLILVF